MRLRVAHCDGVDVTAGGGWRTARRGRETRVRIGHDIGVKTLLDDNLPWVRGLWVAGVISDEFRIQFLPMGRRVVRHALSRDAGRLLVALKRRPAQFVVPAAVA